MKAFLIVSLLFGLTIPAFGELVLQFSFEEGDGNRISSSAPDGPDISGFPQSADFTQGKVGDFALRFDGNSSYVDLGVDDENFNGANQVVSNVSAASFAMWIRIDEYPNGIGTLLSFSTNHHALSTRGGIFISGYGFVEVAGRSRDRGAFQSRLSESPIPLNQWTHVAGAIDYTNSEISLFVNGESVPLQEGSVNFDTERTDTSPSWGVLLGAGGNTAFQFEHFAGSVDDVRVYNHFLSESEAHEIVLSSAGPGIPIPKVRIRSIVHPLMNFGAEIRVLESREGFSYTLFSSQSLHAPLPDWNYEQSFDGTGEEIVWNIGLGQSVEQLFFIIEVTPSLSN